MEYLPDEKYIYIAGPYSNGDPVLNTRNAILAADECRKRGYVPFVAHLSAFWHLVQPHTLAYWYEYDLYWLAKCDALLRLPGDSFGADNEVLEAKERGMPVYYSVRDLP